MGLVASLPAVRGGGGVRGEGIFKRSFAQADGIFDLAIDSRKIGMVWKPNKGYGNICFCLASLSTCANSN